jgi:hypothetical protein
MRSRLPRRHGPALAAALLASCTFHDTATHWNGRVGLDGQPIHVKVSTNLGINLAVLLPLLGNTSIDAMIEQSSAAIGERGSDHLRVIQTTSENYWHGFPPFTWIVTPVITTISIEYRPSLAEQVETARLHALQDERTDERREEDRSHIVPEGPPPSRR